MRKSIYSFFSLFILFLHFNLNKIYTFQNQFLWYNNIAYHYNGIVIHFFEKYKIKLSLYNLQLYIDYFLLKTYIIGFKKNKLAFVLTIKHKKCNRLYVWLRKD